MEIQPSEFFPVADALHDGKQVYATAAEQAGKKCCSVMANGGGTGTACGRPKGGLTTCGANVCFTVVRFRPNAGFDRFQAA